MSFASFNPLTRHPFQTDDPSLLPIAAKVANAERLSFEDGVALYRSGDILAVGRLANLVRERLHGNIAYFNVNRHINPTNVCVASCRLCAFGRKKGEAGTYTMALDEAWETAATGLTEEVAFLAKRGKMTIPEALERMKAAGVDSMPGGGAEIFADRVRHIICNHKIDGSE